MRYALYRTARPDLFRFEAGVSGQVEALAISDSVSEIRALAVAFACWFNADVFAYDFMQAMWLPVPMRHFGSEWVKAGDGGVWFRPQSPDDRDRDL